RNPIAASARSSAMRDTNMICIPARWLDAKTAFAQLYAAEGNESICPFSRWMIAPEIFEPGFHSPLLISRRRSPAGELTGLGKPAEDIHPEREIFDTFRRQPFLSGG